MRRRRWVFLVGGAALLFAATVALIVILSDDALGLLDEELSDQAAYFVTFALIFGDAIIPLLPGRRRLTLHQSLPPTEAWT
jgi:hypothetical protein